MKFLIGTAMFLFASIASADTIAFNLGSYHTGSISDANAEYYGIDEYNEINVGLGYAFELDERTSIEVGFYENSFKQRSVYTYLGIETMDDALIMPRIDVGLVDYDDRIIPFARTTLIFGHNKLLPIKPEIGFTATKDNTIFTFALRFYIDD